MGRKEAPGVNRSAIIGQQTSKTEDLGREWEGKKKTKIGGRGSRRGFFARRQKSPKGKVGPGQGRPQELIY